MTERVKVAVKPGDESATTLPAKLADIQAHNAHLELLVRQTSEHLAMLVKSMTENIAALQSTAAPNQQNHLFVLETQITYLERLAHDLTATAEQQTANDIE